MRINCKSQACLLTYTTAARRAPNFFGKPSAMRRSLDCRGEKKCAKRVFLDLKKSSIAGVRLRSVLRYVRMAHERDRRFLWLKSDGSSPTLTELAHTTRQFMRSEIAYFQLHENFLPVRPRTYKIPNASPKGMHPYEQYKKRSQQKQTKLKRKRYELPTTTKTQQQKRQRTGTPPNNDQ